LEILEREKKTKNTHVKSTFFEKLQLGHVRSLLASHHVDPNESEASWKIKMGTKWDHSCNFWNISGDIHGDIHAEEELLIEKIMIPKNL